MAEAAPEPTEQPETPLALLQRALEHATSVKAWALNKANAAEARITDVGGVPTPEMQALIDEIRAVAA